MAVKYSTYTPSNVSRRLRELAEDGEIQVRLVDGHAHYRLVNKEPQRLRAIAFFDTLPD